MWCTRRGTFFVKKKKAFKWAKHEFSQRACVKNSVYGVETHGISVKEKVLGPEVSKEGHADSLPKHDKIDYKWFPWKKCKCK